MIISNLSKKRKIKQDLTTSKKNVEYYKRMIAQEMDLQFILKENLKMVEEIEAMEKGGSK